MLYHSGYFLALEGGEATGKSTQLKLISERLRSEGHTVTIVREPGGTELGNELREVFLRHQGKINLTAEIAILLASKLELIDKVIKPALNAGHVVISDRYTMSLMVYQGILKNFPLDRLNVMLVATGAQLSPHRTVWLNCDPTLSSARLAQRLEDGVALNSLDTLEIEPLRRLHEAYASVYRDLSAETNRNGRSMMLTKLATDEMDAATTCEMIYQMVRKDLQNSNVLHVVRQPHAKVGPHAHA